MRIPKADLLPTAERTAGRRHVTHHDTAGNGLHAEEKSKRGGETLAVSVTASEDEIFDRIYSIQFGCADFVGIILAQIFFDLARGVQFVRGASGHMVEPLAQAIGLFRIAGEVAA